MFISTIYHIISQSEWRPTRNVISVLMCNNCQFIGLNEHNNVVHLVYGSMQSNRFDGFQ